MDQQMPPRLEIVRPRFPYVSEISLHLHDILESGQVTNNGPWVRTFEERLSQYLGVPTLAFSSGQAALTAMLMAAHIDQGEVIVPSFTFAGTAAAIRTAGARPVFADIRRDTLTIDPADVRRKITTRTLAVLGVDVYGVCCDYDELACLEKEEGIVALFDSAPAFGSLVRGVPTGRFGEAQIFSFHATKPFTTMEGGALCSRNPALIERARQIRNFGLDRDGNAVRVGFNGKMTEVCALIGCKQLERWENVVGLRYARAGDLADAIHGIPGIKTFEELEHQVPIWTYFPILVDNRDAVLAGLHQRGIMARKYYGALHHAKGTYGSNAILPVTDDIASRVIALPLYSDMTGAEIDRVAGALREIVRVS